jgi:hypothetical protein
MILFISKRLAQGVNGSGSCIQPIPDPDFELFYNPDVAPYRGSEFEQLQKRRD